jgi:hypothetical protein
MRWSIHQIWVNIRIKFGLCQDTGYPD